MNLWIYCSLSIYCWNYSLSVGSRAEDTTICPRWNVVANDIYLKIDSIYPHQHIGYTLINIFI